MYVDLPPTKRGGRFYIRKCHGTACLALPYRTVFYCLVPRHSVGQMRIWTHYVCSNHRDVRGATKFGMMMIQWGEGRLWNSQDSELLCRVWCCVNRRLTAVIVLIIIIRQFVRRHNMSVKSLQGRRVVCDIVLTGDSQLLLCRVWCCVNRRLTAVIVSCVMMC